MLIQISDPISTGSNRKSAAIMNPLALGAKPIKKSTRGINPMPRPRR